MLALQKANLSSLQHFGSSGHSPIIFLNQMLWGLISVVQVPRVWLPAVGHKPHNSWRNSSLVGSLPIGCHTEVFWFFLARGYLPLLPILMWSFNSLLWRNSSYHFKFFSEGIVPYIASDLGLRRSFMVFLCHNLLLIVLH